MSPELSEQEQIRRQSLQELISMGINPYPPETYEINASATDILKNYPENQDIYQDVSIAGRIMSRRIMGAAAFVELQDHSGKIQLYFKRDDICPGEDKSLYNIVFKRLLDIGDIIGVKGYVFTTKMGEITIHVTEYKLLSKSLKPLPVVKEKEGKVWDRESGGEENVY